MSVHSIGVTEHGRFVGTVATFRPLLESDALAHGSGVEPFDNGGRSWHDGLDKLTGLLGRDDLQRLIASLVPTGFSRAVAVLNVDGFALVNQTYGPDAGDEVLRQVGRRLFAASGDAVAGRWQSDEFVFVMDASDPVAALGAIVEAAAHAVREPLSVGDQCIYLTVSVGMASSDSPWTGASSLRQLAPCEVRRPVAGIVPCGSHLISTPSGEEQWDLRRTCAAGSTGARCGCTISRSSS